MNLVESLKELAGPGLVAQASSLLGESESSVGTAISAAIPTVLGGILTRVGDLDALGNLLEQFKNTAGGSISDQIGGLLSESDNDELKASKSILDGSFSGRQADFADLVSKLSGVKVASASRILALVGSLIGKVLGNKAITDGLDASGFAALLNEQKANILSGLPAGAAALLGLAEMPRIAMPTVVDPTASAPIESAPVQDLEIPRAAGTNWLVPAIGAAVVAATIWWFTRPVAAVDPVEGTKPPISIETPEPKPNSTQPKPPVKTNGQASVRTLPDGTKLRVAGNSIEGELLDFLEDASRPADDKTWFNFRKLNFDAGKSTLKSGTYDEIVRLASILKAYPHVTVKIGGYTDNTGDPEQNRTLSAARAKSVLVALSAFGVESGRLESEGYGSDFPVASNDTEEGRAANRRIAIRVTTK